MTGPQSVVVGMATYRRPDLLADLLPRIIEQIEHAAAALEPAPEFRVVVVDNDPDASAEQAAGVTGDPRIRYVVEPEPGISSARNRILDEAHDGEVLVMLDDDETPHPGWLLHLLTTYVAHEADAVSGPVHAVFENGEDPWVIASGSYDAQRRAGMRTGTIRARAATNNLLLDMRRIGELGLRFHPGLGTSGGEDSLLTGQLTAAGGRIVWCAEAIVDDLVPAARNTRRFNLSRRFAQSSTTVRVDQMLTSPWQARVMARLRWLVIGLGQLVKGIVLVVLGRLTGNLSRRAKGEGRIAGGAGVLAGCFGVTAQPYSRT